MNNTASSNTPASRIVFGTALAGVVIMGLVALGISEYDGYMDELLVYQSLALGLSGGLVLSGSYLLFTRIKTTKPEKYHPPIIGYTAPLQNKRTPILPTETPISQMVETKSVFKKILYYFTYFSIFGLIGISLGFLGSVVYIFFNLGEIFDNAANEYSILIFILLPLELISIILAGMGIGGIVGAILGFIFKIFSKQTQTI